MTSASSRSPAPSFSFILTHHVLNPFDPSASRHAIGFGIFATLVAAREAAQVAINSTILELTDFGFTDFSTRCKDTAAWTRELAMVSDVDGKEGVLSRFVVDRVEPRVDGAVNAPGLAVVVRLPPAPHALQVEGGHGEQGRSHCALYVGERAPSWSQARIPRCGRRDRRLCRDVSVGPYGGDVERGLVDQELS
jgi:hypothetical protein